MYRLLLIPVLAVFVGACAAGSVGEPSTTQAGMSQVKGPNDPDARIAPDVIRLERTQVTAGEQLEIFFPKESIRGVHFALEARDDSGWDLRHHLLSDWGGERNPQSFPAGSPTFAVEDVGIGGPGPDTVVIPHDAEPGEYRICTGNMRDNVCALLTIDPAG